MPSPPKRFALLEAVGAQIGVVVENSRVYERMKERDRLALLGQMAAGLAHEIRNPLGAIKGAAQLLAEPAPGVVPDMASKEFLGIILEEVDRLDRVVGSVLDLARPHEGTVLPIDVNATVRRTLQILSAEPESEEITTEVTLDPTLPRVAIDAEQLRQVLMNLLHNAVQAMMEKGKIAIGTRVRFGRGTRGGERYDEPFVELSITDNGPGISQKVLGNLFMPFFSTKRRERASGYPSASASCRGRGAASTCGRTKGRGAPLQSSSPWLRPREAPRYRGPLAQRCLEGAWPSARVLWKRRRSDKSPFTSHLAGSQTRFRMRVHPPIRS